MAFFADNTESGTYPNAHKKRAVKHSHAFGLKGVIYKMWPEFQGPSKNVGSTISPE